MKIHPFYRKNFRLKTPSQIIKSYSVWNKLIWSQIWRHLNVPSVKMSITPAMELFWKHVCIIFAGINLTMFSTWFQSWATFWTFVKTFLNVFRDCLTKVIESCSEAEIKCPYTVDYLCDQFLQDREIRAVSDSMSYSKKQSNTWWKHANLPSNFKLFLTCSFFFLSFSRVDNFLF